jgi:hypothetical protein
MTNDLARWQFAITIIFHFFFPPVTIGLALLGKLLRAGGVANLLDEFTMTIHIDDKRALRQPPPHAIGYANG